MGSFDGGFVARCFPRELAEAELAIETGTCLGFSTRLLARRFPRVVTIELDPALSKRARLAMGAEGFSNVRFLQGDSATRLRELLPELPAARPVLFFLDAHWSGCGYGFPTAHLGATATPGSEEQVPLLRELDAIAAHCKGPALIVIDDLKNLPQSGRGLRDVGFPGEDWSHLSREAIRAALGTRLRGARLRSELAPPIDALDEQWLLSLGPLEPARYRAFFFR